MDQHLGAEASPCLIGKRVVLLLRGIQLLAPSLRPGVFLPLQLHRRPLGAGDVSCWAGPEPGRYGGLLAQVHPQQWAREGGFPRLRPSGQSALYSTKEGCKAETPGSSWGSSALGWQREGVMPPPPPPSFLSSLCHCHQCHVLPGKICAPHPGCSPEKRDLLAWGVSPKSSSPVMGWGSILGNL